MFGWGKRGKPIRELQPAKRTKLKFSSVFWGVLLIALFLPLNIWADNTQAPYLRGKASSNPKVDAVLIHGDTYVLDLATIFSDDDSPLSSLTYYVSEDGGAYQPAVRQFTYIYHGEEQEVAITLAFKAGDGGLESPVYQVILRCYTDSARVPSLVWLDYKIGPTGVTIVSCEKKAIRIDIPDYIEGKPVTNIAADAFSNCQALTEIRLPAHLKTIGNQAFLGCINLRTVELPEGLSQVGERSFKNCTSLSAINIPASLQKFNMNILENCREFSFTVAEDNPSYTLQDGVLYDKNLTMLLRAGTMDSGKLQVPDSVTMIGAQAFQNNQLLNSIALNQNVRTIGDNAFDGCNMLREVILSEGLEQVGGGAFRGTTALQTLKLPDSLEILGQTVFRESGLEKIDLSNTLLTVLPMGTFWDCIQLKEITLGDRIRVVEGKSFSGCALKEITLPAYLTFLQDSAFSNCTNLEIVRFPYILRSLGSSVFGNCTALREVYFEGNMPARGRNMPDDNSGYPRYNDSFALLPLAVAENLKIYVLQGAQGWEESFKDYADGAGATNRKEYEYKVNYYTLKDRNEEQIPRLILHAPTSFAGLEERATADPIGVIRAGLSESESLEWSSSDTGVAVVDEEGRVTALKEGISTITAALSHEGVAYRGEVNINVIGPTVFDWTLRNDGTVILNGFKDGMDELQMRYLEIPETIAGYPVAAIKDRAFEKNPFIVSVKIPGTLKTIGMRAFYYCVSLRDVILEEGINQIWDAAFQGTDIREIAVPQSVAGGGSLDNPVSAMTDVFRDCRNLESATIKSGNLESLSGTFRDNIKLKKVSLAEGIKEIGAWTFGGNTSLESIALPSTVQRIGSAFTGATNLKSIELKSFLLAEDPDTNQFEGYQRDYIRPVDRQRMSIQYGESSEDLIILHPDDGNDWGSIFNNQVKTGVRMPGGAIRLDDSGPSAAEGGNGGTGYQAVINEINYGNVTAPDLNKALETADAVDDNANPAGGEKKENTAKEATVFEVVKKAVVENPWVSVAAGAMMLMMIVLGGAGRYRKHRKEQ